MEHKIIIIIADSFNAYFSTIDELIANNVSDNNGSSNNNCLNYLFQTFRYPFPEIKFNYTSTKEILVKI
jgi:hypothetical protein